MSLDDIERGLFASLLVMDGCGDVVECGYMPRYCKLERALIWVAMCDSAFT